MKKWIAGLMLATFAFIPTVWASSDDNQAQQVIESWFAAMKDKQFEKAESFLAPKFVSLHTDGIVRNKQQEMKLIRNLDMTSYQLSDFSFSHSGDDIVVTYRDKGMEKIDSQNISAKNAGRLAVLQKQKDKKKDKWLILAYANLDAIK